MCSMPNNRNTPPNAVQRTSLEPGIKSCAACIACEWQQIGRDTLGRAVYACPYGGPYSGYQPVTK